MIKDQMKIDNVTLSNVSGNTARFSFSIKSKEERSKNI